MSERLSQAVARDARHHPSDLHDSAIFRRAQGSSGGDRLSFCGHRRLPKFKLLFLEVLGGSWMGKGRMRRRLDEEVEV